MVDTSNLNVRRIYHSKDEEKKNLSFLTRGKEKICMHCAKCCKQFRWYIDESMALRLMFLDVDNIIIEEHIVGDNRVYIMVIDAPCKFLKQRKDGSYYCEIYGANFRPWDCRMYPDNIPVHLWDIEKDFCPVLKDVVDKIRRSKSH